MIYLDFSFISVSSFTNNHVYLIVTEEDLFLDMCFSAE